MFFFLSLSILFCFFFVSSLLCSFLFFSLSENVRVILPNVVSCFFIEILGAISTLHMKRLTTNVFSAVQCTRRTTFRAIGSILATIWCTRFWCRVRSIETLSLLRASKRQFRSFTNRLTSIDSILEDSMKETRYVDHDLRLRYI